jgi:hypothetical protein
MAEIYTCTCGGQRWKLFGRIIECDKCGKEYCLTWLDDEMESPKDFNERIKTEEHGGLVAVQKSFTKKLIDDKEE